MPSNMEMRFVPRVNQLDALQLDNDILRIFRDQIIKSIQNLPGGLLHRYMPEIDLFIRSVVWASSIGLNASTFGQRLLFICYDKNQLHTGFRMHLHFVLNVLLKYARDTVAFRWNRKRNLQLFIGYCENTIAFLDILNFFRFLKRGQKPSLIDYILGLDNISMSGGRRREIGYSHMTRELIWSGFLELLEFTLPLINYHYLKRKLKQLLIKIMIIDVGAVSAGSSKPKLGLNSLCEFCKERPTLPHRMGCQHIFCYYCLKGNLLADSQFECPSCGRNSGSMEAL